MPGKCNYVVVLSYLFHPVMTCNMCIKPSNDHETGKRLPVSQFMVLSKIGLQMCFKQCETYATCLSINFNRRMLMCELNSQKKNESLLLVDDSDFIYKEVPGVFDYKDKKCGNLFCDQHSKCVQTKFNNFVCITIAESYLDCEKIVENNPNLPDGVYNIVPDNKTSVRVYCDMTTDGGGWTVIQRRFDGITDFQREWNDYKKGFGDPGSEYWLGNDKIHALTSGRNQELRIDLEKFTGTMVYARYSHFSVGSKSSKYQLSISGYSGNAGDMMIQAHDLNGMYFTTKDRDNDITGRNCAVTDHTGGWWYRSCTHSDLNGVYQPSDLKNRKGLFWGENDENMKTTRMMIKSKK